MVVFVKITYCDKSKYTQLKPENNSPSVFIICDSFS